MRSQKPFCEKEIADSAKILSEEDEIPSYIDLSVLPTLYKGWICDEIYVKVEFSIFFR